VDVKALRVADYAVGRGALVERKAVSDLHATIVEGRLWRQVGQLRRAASMPYLLVEVWDLDDGPLTAEAVRGALLAVTDLGVAVIRSADTTDSARWLRLLALRRQSPAARYRPVYAQRPKAPAGLRAAEAALSAVPRISTVTAQALLDHFGSLAAVVAADPTEWEQVPGVGPARARALASTLRAPFTTSRSRRRRERRGPST
jgi:Fanconi anemia group M protein